MEAATCLAEEMSFSWLAWPWTAALAASHRLLVAAATIRAYRRERVKIKVCVSLWPIPFQPQVYPAQKDTVGVVHSQQK